MRDFLTIQAPRGGAEITVMIVSFRAERLTAGNESRVTLMDYLAHGVFESLINDLFYLKAIDRNPFAIQITGWSAKKKMDSPSSVRMQLRPGAVYELRQVHNVVFFGGAPKEIVQLEEGVLERVVQRAAPLLKRKPGH
ncbi:hypothetical protein PI124_g7439 [Phytophthora idaei]|nr:hypothetical protein PI125_g11869 [Phytophthora idaei]KAG3151399.1 hypothetical protein PI126_g11027 [Phytophthora idaei]KAG3247866.1 hypothetical protein PI124_g7439 [Phytophthora idaei]